MRVIPSRPEIYQLFPAIAQSDEYKAGPASARVVLRLSSRRKINGDRLILTDSGSEVNILARKKGASYALLIDAQDHIDIAKAEKENVRLCKNADQPMLVIFRSPGEAIWIGKTKLTVKAASSSQIDLELELHDNNIFQVQRSNRLSLPEEVDHSLETRRDDPKVLRIFKPEEDYRDELSDREILAIEEATRDGGFLNYEEPDHKAA